MRHVREGRTTRSSDGGGWRMYSRRGREERKWSESVRRWVIPDKAFAKASGGKYPTLGILSSRRSTRPVKGERSRGSAGMATLVKWRVRRRAPHRKELGRASCVLSLDRRTSSSSSENGSEIAERFSRSDFVTVRLMVVGRLDCFSAAIIFSSSSRDRGSRF